MNWKNRKPCDPAADGRNGCRNCRNNTENTRRFVFVLATVFLLVLVSGCTNPASNETKTEGLVGKWKLLKSVGGWGGITIDWEKDNFPIKVEFTKEGIYRKFKNNTLIIESGYTILVDTLEEKVEKILIIEDQREQQFIDFIDENNLELMENCCDCFKHFYKRII